MTVILLARYDKITGQGHASRKGGSWSRPRAVEYRRSGRTSRMTLLPGFTISQAGEVLRNVQSDCDNT